jgi:co-chaperonin GroES (HSP10)
MQLQPLKDQVIVRPVRRVEAVRGGIILPDLAREQVQRGVVLAVGPRCAELTAGDEVLFERHGGVMFANDGESLLRFAEADVLAVVERPEGGSVEDANIWVLLDAITQDRDRWRLS